MLTAPSLDASLQSLDLTGHALLLIVPFLNPEVVRDLMLLDHYFNAYLKQIDYWKEKTKRYFADDYKKCEKMPHPNWYEIFKRLYHLHYDGLPARTIKIFSAVHSSDIAELEKVNLVYEDFYLQDNKKEYLKNYIACSQDQCLMNYFFNKLVLPYYKNKNGDGYSETIKDSRRCTFLHLAAQFNQPIAVWEVKDQVLAMCRIEAGDFHFASPMHLAAQHGHVNVVNALIDCGISVDCDLPLLGTPLTSAARAGQVGAMKVLCDRGAKINVMAPLTPLQAAAKSGNYEAFIFLINCGADPKPLADNQMTLLHFAAAGGSAEVVDYIIKNIADVNVNAADEANETPLHLAAREGHFDVFMKLLLTADMTMIGAEGTLLHYAAMGMNSDIIRYIIGLDLFDIDARNEYGQTPLYCAASMWNKVSHAVIDILLEAGADVNAAVTHDPIADDQQPDEGRETPLHCAIRVNDKVTAGKLVKNQADLKATTSHGSTPVQYCIYWWNRFECLEVLINGGALVEKNALPNRYSFDFSKKTMADYVFVMLLNAAPNLKQLNLCNMTVMQSGHSGNFNLALNALPFLKKIGIDGCPDSLLPLLKILLKAAPHAQIVCKKDTKLTVLATILPMLREVYEEVGHRWCGYVLAAVYEKGDMPGFSKNLAYAKEIYTSIDMKKNADAVQQKINAINVSAIGIFAPLAEIEATEKRVSNACHSPSKRQKK